MGILSALQNLVSKNVSYDTRMKVVSGVDTALTVLTSPIAALKDFGKAKAETSKKSATKLVAEGVENTLIVLTPFTSGAKTIAGKVLVAASSSLPRAALSLTAIGAAATSPTIRKTAITALTPSNYIGAGEKLGSIIEELPTGIKNISGKGVVLAATGLGLTGLAAAGGKLLYDDIKDGGLFDNEIKTDLSNLPTEINKNLPVATIPTNTETPKLPETISLSPTPTRKRRKATKKQPTNMTQRTNIIINNTNNSTKLKTKKYLKAQVL